jgi:hypothetical protein
VANGDPLIMAILGPWIDAEATKGFLVLMGTKEQQGKWTMLGLPTAYLQTIPSGERPTPYAEGLVDVSALVAVVRRRT